MKGLILLLVLVLVNIVYSYDAYGECPPNNQKYVALRHPDCTKFYVCNFGKKVEMNCGDGTEFNSRTMNCDWPKNAQCTSGWWDGSIPEDWIRK